MASVPQFDYIKEFNANARLYLKSKTEESEIAVNRTSTIICNSVEAVDFSPKNIETNHFYNNLYAIITTLNVDSPLLWSSILILQRASQTNEDAQCEFVHRFMFVSIISCFIPEVICKTDKLTKILVLLENITHGIKITREQPYLKDLMDVLIKLIMENDESIGKISLSILINLCHNNAPTTRILLKKNVNSLLFHQVKNYGILPLQLYLLTERQLTDLYDDISYQRFLKSTFKFIESTLDSRDVFMLEKTVTFMKEAVAYENILKSFEGCPNIIECIQSLIDKINSIEMKSEINNNSKGVGLALRFLDIILSFNIPLADFYPKIVNIIESWIKLKSSSVDAMNLLRTICAQAHYKDSESLFNKFEQIITKLVEKSNAKQLEHKQTAALLLLISVIIKTQNLRKLLSGVNETFFNQILTALTQMDIAELQSKILSNDEIMVLVFCLNTLLEFSKNISSVWEDKLNALFKMQQVHYIIAQTMLLNDPFLINYIFKLAKKPLFPGLEVSEIIATQASLMILKVEPKTEPVVQCCDLYHKMASEEFETRVNEVLETIGSARISDMSRSDLIKMYECKMEMCEDEVNNLKHKLCLTEAEVNTVNRKLSLISAENIKYRSTNYSLSSDQEVLYENIKETEDKFNQVTTVMEGYKRKFEIEREKFTDIGGQLTKKEKELVGLHKQYSQTKAENIKMSHKYKSLEKEMAEKLMNYNEMKKTLKTSQESGKLKDTELETLKVNIEKSTKQLSSLKVESGKNETVIKSLEQEIKEKNKQIKELEIELKEAEETKNMVMNLFQKKQKR